MNPELLVFTIGYGISTVITIGLGIFVLFSHAKKETRIPFFIFTVAVAIYEVGTMVGVNVKDTMIAYRFFQTNLTDIFIVMFNAHWILSVLDKEIEKRKQLYLIYAIGVALFIFYLFFPKTFMLPPVPKLYFPNYYVLGDLYFLQLSFFFIIVAYCFYHLVQTYRLADAVTKNRIQYFMITLAVGYGLGSTAFFLAYGFNFDPILSMLLGFYTIPLAYGIVKYQLMDIKVVIKKAFFYSVGIAIAGGIITAISLLNDWFVSHIAGFRFWFIPLFSGVITVIVGKLFWNKSKEADKLKYEFITVAAHKLRTPLTRIKWSADMLSQGIHEEKDQQIIGEIYKANDRLVELVNILLETSKTEEENYLYKLTPLHLEDMVKSAISDLKPDSEKKNLNVSFQTNDHLPLIKADTKRIKSVVRILIENAITYTPSGGTVDVSLGADNRYLTFSIKDSGIGISKEDLPYIFEKFYRSHKASVTDTEGSGLGLFIAKNIIEKHGGTIGAESKGEGEGSRFWFTLPIAH